MINSGGKWPKDYVVPDLEAINKNYDSKFIKARRIGDV